MLAAPVRAAFASPPRSAYVHSPFCAWRCGYCNFTVVAGRDDLAGRYLKALSRELGGLESPREVDTLFIGGGTPTHLPAGRLAEMLELVRRWFPLAENCEFSVEANPADLRPDGVKVLREMGVNRVSLGAQSFDAGKLRMLERDHDAAQIARSVELARSVGGVSLDLIFAAPDESLATWRSDVKAALALQPDHISIYGLTFERGTSFWSRRRKGSLREVDEETQRGMFESAIDMLGESGWEHYEVSNFARPGRRCRHNEVYWDAESYYAAGAGAARYVDGRRETNHRSTTTYIQRMLSDRSPVAESERLSPEDRAREALMLGLRRVRGVHKGRFAERFGFTVESLAEEAIQEFARWGLVDNGPAWLRLSRNGLLVSDSLWPRLLRK